MPGVAIRKTNSLGTVFNFAHVFLVVYKQNHTVFGEFRWIYEQSTPDYFAQLPQPLAGLKDSRTFRFLR